MGDESDVYGGDATIWGGNISCGILVMPGGFGSTESVYSAHVHRESFGVFAKDASFYGHLPTSGVALAVGGIKGDGEGGGIAFMIKAVHGPECIPESYFGWFCFHGGQDSGRMVWGVGRPSASLRHRGMIDGRLK